MNKKTITVPPKEEHFVGGRYYRAGESYEIEAAPVKAAGKPKQKETTDGDESAK